MMMATGSWVPSTNVAADQARLQGQLRGLVNYLINAANVALTLKNVMAQMTVGTDYTTIETYFGMPAGSGGTLHDVLGTCSDALQASNVQGMIQRFN